MAVGVLSVPFSPKNVGDGCLFLRKVKCMIVNIVCLCKSL